MSVQILRSTTRKAAKERQCIWCPEKITKGEKHLHVASVYDGVFQDHRFHLECAEAMQKDYSEHHEEEFPPHGFKRGTNQEA